MRISVTVLLLLVALIVQSQTMQISLYNHKEINTFTCSVRQGQYMLECDGEKYGEYTKNSIFYLNRQGSKIEVRDNKNLIGVFEEVLLKNQDKESIITLKPIDPNLKSREIDDAILFVAGNNKTQAINHVNLEKYIAGVIEAEGGITAHLEYYKAQAVLVRTYTIKNIYKHAEEDFNLCDGVHCQAYHGRSARNEEIYTATKATAGEVLIDKDSVLIISPFHSSCGGLTSTAGIYWQTDMPYLQSVSDPFCTSHKQAKWEKTIPYQEWATFLRKAGIKHISTELCNYTPNGRRKYFTRQKAGVTFRQIREHWRLRSSYFSIRKSGNNIIFKGQGFGHGIGMCQIGAMEMAKVGFTYEDIIHFYFKSILVTDYREMKLHRY